MRISFAHLREQATTGGWINFAVFDARSNSGSDRDNAALLHSLTLRARASGLRVDQSALAYSESGQLKFYGSKSLVEFLSRSGVPRWTHTIDI